MDELVGVIGPVEGNSIVEKCRFASKGSAISKQLVGGISAEISGGSTIRASANYGTVSGMTYAGGITGYVVGNNSQILSCYNRGEISSTGNAYTGGICGLVYQNAKVTSCYSTGKVGQNYRFGRCSWAEMELILLCMEEL